MPNQVLPILKNTARNGLFYGIVLWIIVTARFTPVPEQAFILKKFLFSGNEKIFQVFNPGTHFSIFDPYLPSRENISLIMDLPYDRENTASEQFQAAQRHFAPRILTPFPIEKKAIIFCSNDELATKRMSETGYKWILAFGKGKGIAEKLS